MAALPSVNDLDQQIIYSDIRDYADRNDIIQLLDIDLAPYVSYGVQHHRYRIEVSRGLGFQARLRPLKPSSDPADRLS